MLISEEKAREMLAAAIEYEGSAAKLSRKLGVSRAFISYMQRGVGELYHRHITGKVAKHLGIRLVYAYELTVNSGDPKQEHYENQRKKWAEEHRLPFSPSPTMRVASDPIPVEVYPEKVQPADKA